MKNLVKIEELSHRSKERIKNLGEVFTPESYVEDMLSLLARDKKGIWADEGVIFFEPCSGHGNIVLSIYRRRLEGIYKKTLSKGLSEAPYYAVANALHTLWAIDIDSTNIENCRSRVLSATFTFLKEKTNAKNEYELITKEKEFFAHILAAIKWHISENETLSALSSPDIAKSNANLTKSGTKWLLKNGHKELDFDFTWASFFESCEESNVTPLEYERSMKFINNFLSGKLRGFDDFEFAKAILDADKNSEREQKSSRSVSVAT